MTPNLFSIFALFVWPIVTLILFVTRPFNQALLWTILGAQLALPEIISLKIQMIPAIDKDSVAIASALFGCALFAKWNPRPSVSFGFTGVLALAFLFCPIVTSALNNDQIVIGSRVLPGVGNYDAISAVIAQTIFFIPYFIGRRLLWETSNAEEFLRVLVIAGIIYSLPMLFEIRMSPQLHRWIYGAFQSSFVNEARYGGFRPTVFMRNGLATAFFMFTSVVAAFALWRANLRVSRLPSGLVATYLMAILVLCKTAGVTVYAALLVPTVWFVKPKNQIRCAVLMVIVATSYPILRTNGDIPTDYLVEIARDFNPQRADSLKTRFDQEQQLLVHASDRFFFGWGRFGRSRVYDENGKDITLTDGRWIITMGTFGFIGFLAEFGLLAMPVFRIARSFRWVTNRSERAFLAAVTLIVAISCIEQLPNDSLSPWIWLMAGALSGRADALSARRAATGRSVNTKESSDQTSIRL